MNVPRESIARAFAGAADYDGNARIQRDIAQTLAARIAALALPRRPRVLEIGCGTGFLTQALAGLGGDWLVTDLSPEMLERCRARLGEDAHRRFAVLDGEYGDPGGGPFDLICSSLAVQWFDDAPRALARMGGWLAPGGHLMVTTLGPGSFAQWREAHAAEGLAAGTPRFAPVAAFGDFAVTAENRIERHDDPLAFLRALKAIGAHAADAGHRPLSPGQLRRTLARFAQSGCEVTYEVVTCHLHRAR
ncbi:methyltransferase [Novosphingobium sp. ST904]|uniref:methyltransferase n=1 Tax=Novosphingobium sp. ST904 TaxID=1684385 RepID=UPI00104D81C5|nr:methyltransferase [Novosphingobium sp. ST904]TCM39357.1 malonyl-CoA O-methyltransferase [Novosphingobium sp. ST904]